MKTDVMIGNPCWAGKHLRLNLGSQYIDRVFKRFPDVKDSLDCSNALPEATQS
jgi:hypothetical protein